MPAFSSVLEGKKVTLSDNGGHSYTSDNAARLFDWLLSRQSMFNSVTWDVDEFSAPIFRLLPVGLLRGLFHTGKAWLDDYYIFYNKTSLCVGRGRGNKAVIYDLKQYYNGAAKPQNAQETMQRYITLVDELRGIGLEAGKLTSPVTMLEPYLYKLNMPTHKDMPAEVNRLAYKCAVKRWSEALKIGHWDKAWDYDLTSGFPSAMADLIDCRSENGDWVHEKEQPQGTALGFARGMLTITKNISPIVFIDIYGNQINHRGTAPFIVAKPELDIIKEFGIGHMNIEEGRWFVPKKEVYPARQFINWLYEKRSRSELLNWVIKSAMVGMYGKMLQEYKDGEYAPFFCCVWGSTTESMVRAKDARFIYGNHLEDNVLHVSTDGILADREVAVPPEKRLGEWRFNGVSPALIVSSNLVFTGSKKPNRLLYNNAMKLIRENPEARYWTTSQRRRMTLGDYVTCPSWGLGQEREAIASFSLATIPYQHDRKFKELPLTGRELVSGKVYTSEPWEVSELAKGDNI